MPERGLDNKNIKSRLRIMYVAQKDEMGCAIACVANLLKISYESTKRFFNPKFASNRGYYCKSIVNALRKSGVHAKYFKVKTDTKFFDGDIVFLARSNSLPEGHWVLKTNQGWIDPWVNFQKTKKISNAKAGVVEKLPGNPEWLVRPTNLCEIIQV